MILQRISTAIRNQHWGTLTLELAVLVVGIFLGLRADDWNESRRERAAEAAYLQELREDFLLNLRSLNDEGERLENIIASMIGLLAEAALPTPGRPGEELNQAFKQMLSMPTFIKVDRAWSNLSGSGELRLLSDRNLRNALARYYTAAEVVAVVQNTHEMQLVQVFQPYIIDQLDYMAVVHLWLDDVVLPRAQEPERILEVLPTRRFRNVVTLKIEICTDLLDQYQQMTLRTQEILTLLGAGSSTSS